MTTWTYPSKNSSSYTYGTTNSASYSKPVKIGSGWTYDQTGITYDGATDPATGLTVYYDSLGIATAYTYPTKN